MKILLASIFSLAAFWCVAQPYSWMGRPRPYKFMVGVGYAAIDDDGRDFCQPFDAQQSWHYLPYPTRILFDCYLKKGLSLDFSGTYMQYDGTKLVNDTTGLSGLFIAVDAGLKYSFYDMIGSNWFDPYVTLGAGGTHRDVYDPNFLFNANASIGFNFWIYRGFGLQLQTSGKFGITSHFYDSNADYLQHTATIVYRFGERRKSTFNTKPRYKSHRKKRKYKGRAAR